MSDDKLKNDLYSNPDKLKQAFIYPDNVEPETKRSRRVPRLFILIALPISFLLGMVIFGRLSYENSVNEVVEVVVTVEVFDSVGVVNEGELSWQLSNGRMTTAEGTFTEWFNNSSHDVGRDTVPWFEDVAYHTGTTSIYLTDAYKNGLYTIRREDHSAMIFTTMAWIDLSLRVNGSIEQVIPYDDEHLLLLTDGGEQLVMYNAVTNRVAMSWHARHQPDDPERYFDIESQGVVVDMDGMIHVLQTVSQDDSYQDEIQRFSATGEYVETVTLPVQYADFLIVTPDNTVLLYARNGLWTYDGQAESWSETELTRAFWYADTAEFHPNGSLYTLGGTEAWLAERLPNGEVGIAYPANENIREIGFWPVERTNNPTAMTMLPDGSFIILDGYINHFQHAFRFELPTPQ